MKFINVRLLVSDFSESLHFWRDLMGFPLSYGDEATGYAYFDTGNAGIELMRRTDFAEAIGLNTSSTSSQEQPAVFVFQVENVDASYADLVKRGATSVSEPQDRPTWQARSAHLSDPDGYIVEIYSPLGPSAS